MRLPSKQSGNKCVIDNEKISLRGSCVLFNGGSPWCPTQSRNGFGLAVMIRLLLWFLLLMNERGKMAKGCFAFRFNDDHRQREERACARVRDQGMDGIWIGMGLDAWVRSHYTLQLGHYNTD